MLLFEILVVALASLRANLMRSILTMLGVIIGVAALFDGTRGAIGGIVAADGVFLTDSEGNRILDGMAGLWCVNIGYGREELAEAAARQFGFARAVVRDIERRYAVCDRRAVVAVAVLATVARPLGIPGTLRVGRPRVGGAAALSFDQANTVPGL